MCGVAQEDTSEDQKDVTEAYTRPWHVTVTITAVRVLHRQKRKQPIWYFGGDFHPHTHFLHCAVRILFRIHREPELGADSCSLLCQSKYRQSLTASANKTRSVSILEDISF